MALEIGPIRAIGGIVYDSQMNVLMNTTNLHAAIQELGQNGISVRRTDSGGSPTWEIADGVKEDAERVVDLLLQDGLQSSCSGCEREFSVKVPAATHGLCKRHTVDSYRQIEKTNPGANYAQKIAEIEARPDSAFPPDLGSPENRQFLNSLEKVDFAKKDADQKAYLDQWRASRGMAKI